MFKLVNSFGDDDIRLKGDSVKLASYDWNYVCRQIGTLYKHNKASNIEKTTNKLQHDHISIIEICLW